MLFCLGIKEYKFRNLARSSNSKWLACTRAQSRESESAAVRPSIVESKRTSDYYSFVNVTLSDRYSIWWVLVCVGPSHDALINDELFQGKVVFFLILRQRGADRRVYLLSTVLSQYSSVRPWCARENFRYISAF